MREPEIDFNDQHSANRAIFDMLLYLHARIDHLEMELTKDVKPYDSQDEVDSRIQSLIGQYGGIKEAVDNALGNTDTTA